MTEHHNAVRIRDGYEAMAKGDPSVLLESLSPDIEWHIPGRHRFAGTYRGIEQLLQHFGELFAVAQEEMSPVEVVASDQRAFALVDVVARAGELSTGPDRNVHLFEFDDEGKIVAFYQYPCNVHAEEAFWAQVDA